MIDNVLRGLLRSMNAEDKRAVIITKKYDFHQLVIRISSTSLPLLNLPSSTRRIVIKEQNRRLLSRRKASKLDQQVFVSLTAYRLATPNEDSRGAGRNVHQEEPRL